MTINFFLLSTIVNIYRWICNVSLHCTRVLSQDYYVISIPVICSGCPLLLTLASPFALLKSAFHSLVNVCQVKSSSSVLMSLHFQPHKADPVLLVAPHFLPILPNSSHLLILSLPLQCTPQVCPGSACPLLFHPFSWALYAHFPAPSPSEARCSALCYSHNSIAQRVKQVWLIRVSLPPFSELGIPPFFCPANTVILIDHLFLWNSFSWPCWLVTHYGTQNHMCKTT